MSPSRRFEHRRVSVLVRNFPYGARSPRRGFGQQIPNVGERFFRPPGQEETGSGLGLSIVKRIAEIHSFGLTMEVTDAPHASMLPMVFQVKITWR